MSCKIIYNNNNKLSNKGGLKYFDEPFIMCKYSSRKDNKEFEYFVSRKSGKPIITKINGVLTPINLKHEGITRNEWEAFTHNNNGSGYKEEQYDMNKDDYDCDVIGEMFEGFKPNKNLSDDDIKEFSPQIEELKRNINDAIKAHNYKILLKLAEILYKNYPDVLISFIPASLIDESLKRLDEYANYLRNYPSSVNKYVDVLRSQRNLVRTYHNAVLSSYISSLDEINNRPFWRRIKDAFKYQGNKNKITIEENKKKMGENTESIKNKFRDIKKKPRLMAEKFEPNRKIFFGEVLKDGVWKFPEYVPKQYKNLITPASQNEEDELKDFSPIMYETEEELNKQYARLDEKREDKKNKKDKEILKQYIEENKQADKVKELKQQIEMTTEENETTAEDDKMTSEDDKATPQPAQIENGYQYKEDQPQYLQYEAPTQKQYSNKEDALQYQQIENKSQQSAQIENGYQYEAPTQKQYSELSYKQQQENDYQYKKDTLQYSNKEDIPQYLQYEAPTQKQYSNKEDIPQYLQYEAPTQKQYSNKEDIPQYLQYELTA